MPKWVLYALAALADFVIAFISYRNGRVLIPIILALAGLGFTLAAIGAARGTKG